MLLTDSRLPSGGYAYSGSLEPGLADGMDPRAIPDYIAARARTVAKVEASAAVLAHRAALDDPDQLAQVHEALAARSPSEPLRDISGLLGRALLRIGRRLWPDHPAVSALQNVSRAPLRPIALGAVAAVMGMDEAGTARASFYDDAQTIAAATLKLAPVDPVETVAWVVAIEPLMATLVDEVLAVESVADMPAPAAPLAEQWSLDHATATRRIFRA